MKKPKLLLLDADVILVSHKLGVWEGLKTKYDVHVASIVATREVQYVKTSSGSYPIDLQAQITAEEIVMVEATASEMAAVTENFVDSFSQGLDVGETEGIAIVRKGELEDCKFCSGDTNGIQAVGMLGLASQSISLEEILDLGGLRGSLLEPLPPHYTKRNHEIQINKGVDRRISGEYFKKSPLDLSK